MTADERFMRMAIELATGNVVCGAGGPFGAVIVKDGVVVATGVNTVTTTCDPTAHAEVTTIRAAAKALGTFELTGCTIYSSCEPCPMCLGAIYWARFERLVFGATAEDAAKAGFDDAAFYAEMKKPAAERSLPSECVLRDEAEESFVAWREFEAKVKY
jgi:guanine deaminase